MFGNILFSVFLLQRFSIFAVHNRLVFRVQILEVDHIVWVELVHIKLGPDFPILVDGCVECIFRKDCVFKSNALLHGQHSEEDHDAMMGRPVCVVQGVGRQWREIHALSES